MRQRTWIPFVLVALSLGAAAPARADLLVKMDESAIQGTYKGGTDAAVILDVKGQVQQIPFAEVLCLLMSPRADAGAAAAPAAAAAGTGPTSVLRRDGKVLRGIYKGGTDSAILLETGGKVEQIPIAQVCLVVSDRPAAAPAVAAAAAPPAPAAASGVVPAGTKLMIALTGDVSTATHKKGSVVEGVLAAPLSVGGAVLAPEGTKVFGKVLDSRGGKPVGGSYIMFSFTEMQIGTQMVPIQTSEVGAEGGKGGAAKKVGAGALIGAAAGDAGAGAAVGGAVAILSSGRNHLSIPKGTKAEVQLKTELKIGG